MTSRKLPIPQGGRRRMRTYLSTVLDNFSRYIIAWKLCTTMKADDVTASHIAGYRVMSLRRTVNCASTLGVLGWETVIAPNADL
jgi:transposase InsO family protein